MLLKAYPNAVFEIDYEERHALHIPCEHGCTPGVVKYLLEKNPREELECINRWQLYMKVFFLSDITSGNGTMILQEAYDGRELKNCTSRWQWPRQPRPPKKHWLLWEIALKEVWDCTETRRISRKLGNWLDPSHQNHKFVYNVSDNTIIEPFTNGRLMLYKNVPERTSAIPKSVLWLSI